MEPPSRLEVRVEGVVETGRVYYGIRIHGFGRTNFRVQLIDGVPTGPAPPPPWEYLLYVRVVNEAGEGIAQNHEESKCVEFPYAILYSGRTHRGMSALPSDSVVVPLRFSCSPSAHLAALFRLEMELRTSNETLLCELIDMPFRRALRRPRETPPPPPPPLLSLPPPTHEQPESHSFRAIMRLLPSAGSSRGGERVAVRAISTSGPVDLTGCGLRFGESAPFMIRYDGSLLENFVETPPFHVILQWHDPLCRNSSTSPHVVPVRLVDSDLRSWATTNFVYRDSDSSPIFLPTDVDELFL